MPATYKTAIHWIAFNDNARDGGDEELIANYISTALVADLFGKTVEQVARKVAIARGE